MIGTFILMFAMAGQPSAQLGTYKSEEACINAIRQIYMMNIYKGVQDSPEVKAMIDTTMQYQQEYKCIKTN